MMTLLFTNVNAQDPIKIMLYGDRLLRFGQNNESEYGESLSVLEIIKLSENDYAEKFIGSIKIDKYKGPHTLNFNKKTNQIVFDYYSNDFSFLAGARRLVALFNK